MTITLVPYHQDERLPDSSFPLPGDDIVTITRDLPDGDVWTRLAALYEPVAAEVADQLGGGTVPSVVSGDCLIAEAVLAGMQRAGLEPSIIWYDAHGDVHSVASSTSGYIGGMPLRQILGTDTELLVDRLGLRPLPEERAVLVDARDLDPGETEYLATSKIRRCGVDDVVLPEGPLLLHIDLDVIDDGDLPGMKFPVGDGPSAESVLASARRIMDTGRVAALDLACPWHPPEGDDNAIRGRILKDLLPA
ncbi:arginase [Actinomadura pelletieri DSM 43383]|uniref:Arginase n=1 Tax=Actinomadura pelletieri DSM 43383 TaxID=1120940 RepID=A0A495QIZ4_9ACTN|nr:arginase family protein [Actinomadura pelletieri]RKS71964.1 arginase [Actinomadura pelletieri DSM 43383]